MPPLNYEIRLHGSTDDGDPEYVREAFRKTVRALRTAVAGKGDVLPITVAGALSGRVEAWWEGDVLHPVEPLLLNVADVDVKPSQTEAARTSGVKATHARALDEARANQPAVPDPNTPAAPGIVDPAEPPSLDAARRGAAETNASTELASERHPTTAASRAADAREAKDVKDAAAAKAAKDAKAASDHAAAARSHKP